MDPTENSKVGRKTSNNAKGTGPLDTDMPRTLDPGHAKDTGPRTLALSAEMAKLHKTCNGYKQKG